MRSRGGAFTAWLQISVLPSWPSHSASRAQLLLLETEGDDGPCLGHLEVAHGEHSVSASRHHHHRHHHPLSVSFPDDPSKQGEGPHAQAPASFHRAHAAPNTFHCACVSGLPAAPPPPPPLGSASWSPGACVLFSGSFQRQHGAWAVGVSKCLLDKQVSWSVPRPLQRPVWFRAQLGRGLRSAREVQAHFLFGNDGSRVPAQVCLSVCLLRERMRTAPESL